MAEDDELYDVTPCHSADTMVSDMKSRIAQFEQQGGRTRPPVGAQQIKTKQVLSPKTPISPVEKTPPPNLPPKQSPFGTASSVTLRSSVKSSTFTDRTTMFPPDNKPDEFSNLKSSNVLDKKTTFSFNGFGRINGLTRPENTSSPALPPRSPPNHPHAKPLPVDPKTGHKEPDVVRSNDGRTYRRLPLLPVLGRMPPKPPKPPNVNLDRFRLTQSEMMEDKENEIYDDTVAIGAEKSSMTDIKSKLELLLLKSDATKSKTWNKKQNSQQDFEDDEAIYDDIAEFKM